jgi:hypothetical protein
MIGKRADAMKRRFSIFDVSVGAVFSVGAMFTARGFSYPTIKSLTIAGIDAPERLLFVTESDLLSIPGIDESALNEIARYRARFAEQPLGKTLLNGPSAVTRAQRAPARLA